MILLGIMKLRKAVALMVGMTALEASVCLFTVVSVLWFYGICRCTLVGITCDVLKDIGTFVFMKQSKRNQSLL